MAGKWLSNPKAFAIKVKQLTGLRLLEPYTYSGQSLRARCGCGTVSAFPALRLLHGKAKCDCQKLRPSKKTREFFIRELKALHGEAVILVGPYIQDGVHTKFLCTVCDNRWKTRPNTLLKGCGCPACANTNRSYQPHKLTHKQYKVELAGIGVTPLDRYVNTDTVIRHRCVSGHIFKASPYRLLRGLTSCRTCKLEQRKLCGGSFHSQVGIRWLEREALRSKTHIRHGNSRFGEYRIPGTRFRVDGYCRETNTVYEFLGDCWHGNPALYHGNKQCHPFNNSTAAELYAATTKRITVIASMGYTVKYIWEQAYKAGGRTRTFRLGERL